ncbi:AP-2 complex subunit sigma domain protein [Aspergillus tubingensis]|uniref:AP-2 complex subunit sigma domain protein n=1 Tax=Aspergillus tubingensis TaxID=5068 RepID=UPI001579621E|nr:AP-2 complex subunit sigma domain protein [Aspergillus tubingensis]GFN18728.1 AP-2 complex subunit sigma domain protein [Aspergillus tubingensis]
MPAPDVDDKLLLAGLETTWDSADRLAVPHLHIPKTRADEYGPPSPCYSYTSSASSATRSPSASEWRFKPLPPVPGIKWRAKLSQRVPYELYAPAVSTPAHDAPSYNSCIFDVQTNHTSTSCSALWCGSSAYNATSSDASVFDIQTYNTSSPSSTLRCDIAAYDTPVYDLPTSNPSTYHPQTGDSSTYHSALHAPIYSGPYENAPGYIGSSAAGKGPRDAPEWPQVFGIKAEQLPPAPNNQGYGHKPKPSSPTDLHVQQKQPVKKTSKQELKPESDEKPLWQSLKAGVRRVLTRKAVSHDGGALKHSKTKKNKYQNVRRASIIVRMSTIPPIQRPPEENGQGFLDGNEDDGHYEDAIKRMKNVLASLLEDGYTMDMILQAESNQQFLRSLFTRVQNEPLLGVDTAPSNSPPPTSHSSLPPDHTCELPPHDFHDPETVDQPVDQPMSQLFDKPIRRPTLGDDTESNWEYVGYDEDEAFTEGAPSVRFFTGPAPDQISEPRSSVPPFAAVMAALDDDLQRMVSNRWSLSKPGMEDMILNILLQIDDLDDLFSFAQTSRATYHVFKRHELPLMENTIRRRSPAAWELRQISDINENTDSQDLSPATIYYRAVTRDLRALATLKGLMMTHCRGVMRTSSYTALARPSGPEARRLDNAIWRVWTFCFLFGMQTGRETDMDGQVSWLRGETGSPFQPCPDPKDVASILFDPPPGFGEGNAGGLSVSDMQDMDEVWTCLKYMLGFLRGETERARRFGVFQNAGLSQERNQGMIVLHEWINYLLSLGPEAVVELAPLGPDTHAETTFQRAMSRGWTTWSAPEPGSTRSAFLTDALGRVSGGLRRLEELQMTLWYSYV